MAKFQLVLFLHAHQPVGNFDDVIERAYQDSYRPFIEVLSEHPAIHVGLHYSGPLLEWAERAHPEYFDKLRGLVERGQVEMVGGGFYEPVLIAIPERDRQEQLTRLADYVEKHFTKRPTGAWLTERVWEPQLPSSLAQADVKYTLVDDNHFLGAGFETEQLYGYYTAENMGHVVRLIPGLKILRYTIPFRPPEDTIQFLREASATHPGGFAAMGDDLEKLGSWPETHKHCYDDGWVTNFFSEIEKCADWLETATPSMAMVARPAQGRADLPTASYTEMMEWSLPTRARIRYHNLVKEFESRPEALPFLRGGTWRNFFSKYSEANLLHAKMLHVSDKVHAFARRKAKSAVDAIDAGEATTSLLRGECNDPYWHGVFGGLYMPHLRTAAWRALSHAEALVDARTHKQAEYAEADRLDFDADGNDEICLTSSEYSALIQPSDGGTLSALDLRKTNVPLINSLMRRLEAYHDAVRKTKSIVPEHFVSIHDEIRAKEANLDKWLTYDRWRRNSFRVLLFATERTFEDYAPIRLDEDGPLAGGRYRLTNTSKRSVELVSEESCNWSLTKLFSFAPSDEGFEVTCDLTLKKKSPGDATVQIGLEVVVNFLAPAATDRYFDANGQRFPLRWSAKTDANPLRVIDEWQKTGVSLYAPGAREFWLAPIETVSESEGGFERIYQGSQIAPIWLVPIASSGEWHGKLTLRAFQVG
ncbi:MAG TPA: alpha-amylase/4-alpha-glucanotransferase domain-containing protein [Candidatus Acidoferrales bacterium]|nr:alpha-amylase/4-alpha-glucanotransferase domain-containing protein [Candidatus Acidoferrales bacterium]